MKFKKLVVVAVLLLPLSACIRGADRLDLEGVPGKTPDKIEVVLNIDGHPNVVRFCLGGLAYYTVRGDSEAPRATERLHRVADWDGPFCGGVAR